MENNKSKELARFEELKAQGYKKLKGADREEYSTLLEKYPELNLNSSEDLEETNEEETPIESEDESNEEEVETPKKSLPRKSRTVEKNYFTLKSDVLHNGNLVTKGTIMEKDHALFATFQKAGFLE